MHSNIYPVLFNLLAYDKGFNFITYRTYTSNAMLSFFMSMNKFNKIKFINNKVLSIKRNKNKSILNKFLNFFFRRGLKIQYTNTLNSSVSDFYFFFFFFNKSLNNMYKGYSEIYNLIPNFLNFYNFGTMLNFLNTLLEPFFFIKVKKVEKKYRKKLKKKFVAQPSYVQPHKRVGLVLRSILYYTNLFSSYKLSERLSLGLFKLLVEQKNSYLYRRKIYMYSKMFKKFQKKVV